MKVNFDADFIEFRLRAHRLWQRKAAEQMTAEILDEVVWALKSHAVRPEERTAVLPFPEPSTHNSTNRRLNL